MQFRYWKMTSNSFLVNCLFLVLGEKKKYSIFARVGFFFFLTFFFFFRYLPCPFFLLLLVFIFLSNVAILYNLSLFFFFFFFFFEKKAPFFSQNFPFIFLLSVSQVCIICSCLLSRRIARSDQHRAGGVALEYRMGTLDGTHI